MSNLGFPSELVPAVVCQSCLGKLHSISNESYVRNGALECSVCGIRYPIEEGILVLLGGQHMDNIRESEVAARDSEAAHYDRRLAARHAKEVPSTLAAMPDLSGKYVIEYGAGTGRLTVEYAKFAKGTLACDFSIASLAILREKIGSETVALVCADATTLRTASEFFDVALATQFYEHIPTPTLRREFLLHCRETLHMGGEFVSTTYHYDLRMRLTHKPQEGIHRTGIFYHYYTAEELESDIGKFFSVTRITPIDITLPLEARLSLPASWGGALSRMAERIPLLNKFGHLLLAIAEKK